ncbi:hypothetical protein BDW75DRAFT_245987 [Aspergillus navahoensis]
MATSTPPSTAAADHSPRPSSVVAGPSPRHSPTVNETPRKRKRREERENRRREKEKEQANQTVAAARRMLGQELDDAELDAELDADAISEEADDYEQEAAAGAHNPERHSSEADSDMPPPPPASRRRGPGGKHLPSTTAMTTGGKSFAGAHPARPDRSARAPLPPDSDRPVHAQKTARAARPTRRIRPPRNPTDAPRNENNAGMVCRVPCLRCAKFSWTARAGEEPIGPQECRRLHAGGPCNRCRSMGKKCLMIPGPFEREIVQLRENPDPVVSVTVVSVSNH